MIFLGFKYEGYCVYKVDLGFLILIKYYLEI